MTLARATGWTALTLMGLGSAALLYHLASAIAGGDLADYGPALMRGLWLTVLITMASFGLGLMLAVGLTLASLSRNRVLRLAADGLVALFRSSPLIAQLYIVYYGAGQISAELEAMSLWWLFRSPLNCVLLVFTLNTACYQAYVMRGAIASLPPEQTEAALALGLSRRTAFLKVLAPQAMAVALRPLGNELTKMIKASSIASTVTVFDLLGTSNLIYNETLSFDAYVIAAVIYVAAVEVTRRGTSRLSDRLTRHERKVT